MKRFDRLVITGTGRSGTRYMSELLTKLGLSVSHQAAFHERFDGGLIEWEKHVGDSSGLAAPFVQHLPETVLVIHQVRHPAKVIRSLLRNGHVPGTAPHNPAVQRYADHVPQMFEENDLVLRACLLWVHWNRLVKKIALQPNYLQHRVEDTNQEFLTKVLGFFGLPWNAERRRIFQAQSREVGTNPSAKHYKGPLDLSLIPGPIGHLVRDEASNYGYEV